MGVRPPDRTGESSRPDQPENGEPVPKKGKIPPKKFRLPERDQRKAPSKDEEEEEALFGMMREKKQAITPTPKEPPGPPPKEPEPGPFGPPSDTGKTPAPRPPNKGPPPPSQRPSSSGGQTGGSSQAQGQGGDSQTPQTGQTQQKDQDQDQDSNGDKGQLQGPQESPKEFEAAMTEAIGAGGMVTDLSKINALIQELVSNLYTGTVGGDKITGLELKGMTDIPDVFAGTTLTVRETADGLVINFGNFATPTQEGQALSLMQQNQQQLTDLVQALNAKNIQIASVQVGDRMVPLPQQAIAGREGSLLDRERGGEEGDRGGGQQERERRGEEEGPEGV